ncbi:hypothetical protein COV82_04255 [Candidatus Peregrinibacteria bacterium CG11_big_fil_rev_8_21_14_0_20_46_8]|nr:MAG: hypothetical protein COV82_04255 [Candidatus Peregrinibacteria bacterium CG11_big_fil_rev_8_21_14_0_20_46_8]
MPIHSIFRTLQQNGNRITMCRRALISLLFESPNPLSILDLKAALQQEGLEFDKSTLYREIQFLMNNNLTVELCFHTGEKKYEWKREHHHHLICRRCDAIEEVQLDELENVLPSIEKKIHASTKFTKIDHALDFFGLCVQCAK